jgi:hypothetical protein
MAPHKLIALGVKLARSNPSMNVIPSVNNIESVSLVIEIASPIMAGISSHLNHCYFSVVVARPKSFGDTNRIIPSRWLSK